MTGSQLNAAIVAYDEMKKASLIPDDKKDLTNYKVVVESKGGDHSISFVPGLAQGEYPLTVAKDLWALG